MAACTAQNNLCTQSLKAVQLAQQNICHFAGQFLVSLSSCCGAPPISRPPAIPHAGTQQRQRHDPHLLGHDATQPHEQPARRPARAAAAAAVCRAARRIRRWRRLRRRPVGCALRVSCAARACKINGTADRSCMAPLVLLRLIVVGASGHRATRWFCDLCRSPAIEATTTQSENFNASVPQRGEPPPCQARSLAARAGARSPTPPAAAAAAAAPDPGAAAAAASAPASAPAAAAERTAICRRAAPAARIQAEA